jgi:phage baseplate assembly protein W
MSAFDPSRAFLGSGWAFPICRAGSAGADVELVAYDEDVKQAIRIILGTGRGERLMRPDFGAGLNQFVFEPLSMQTMQLVRARVREALVDWEPRIDVDDVEVKADGAVRNLLLITLRCRVRATNTRHNLVYPFYLQEGARV